MPSKRQVLELLSRAELQSIADERALTVADRRVREQLIDAAADAYGVVLRDILATFTRDRLKELCRAIGVDDSGREKSAFVDRLVGAAEPKARQQVARYVARGSTP